MYFYLLMNKGFIIIIIIIIIIINTLKDSNTCPFVLVVKLVCFV